MKDNEKKVNATEEATTEENGVQLTDEQLENVNGGLVRGVELVAVELAAEKTVTVAQNELAKAAK